MWCYANHPLTLPILFTVSLGGGQPGTPRPFIWKSGQTVKRRTPATRWTLIFTNITFHITFQKREIRVFVKSRRQLRQFLRRGGKYRLRGGRAKFSQKPIQGAHMEKNAKKCTLIKTISCFPKIKKYDKGINFAR